MTPALRLEEDLPKWEWQEGVLGESNSTCARTRTSPWVPWEVADSRTLLLELQLLELWPPTRTLKSSHGSKYIYYKIRD